MERACSRAGIPRELAPLLLALGWPADKSQWPSRVSVSVLVWIESLASELNPHDLGIWRVELTNAVDSGELRGYYKTVAGDWLTPGQYANSEGGAESYPYVDITDYAAWRDSTTPANQLLTLLIEAAPPVRRSQRGAPRKAAALDHHKATIQLAAERIYRHIQSERGHPPKKDEVAEHLAATGWPSYSPATLKKYFHPPQN